MKEVKDVVKFLDAFPNVSDLALFLKAKGVKGRRNAADSCPVATYLQQETGNSTVNVSRTTYSYADRDHRSHTENSSGVVQEFVSLFDSGYFPELNKGSF